MVRKKKKKIPKTHRYKVDDVVVFHFAGSTRTGTVIELTKEADTKHATYTVSSGGIIYPCLGLNGSKEVGNVLAKETKLLSELK